MKDLLLFFVGALYLVFIFLFGALSKISDEDKDTTIKYSGITIGVLISLSILELVIIFM